MNFSYWLKPIIIVPQICKNNTFQTACDRFLCIPLNVPMRFHFSPRDAVLGAVFAMALCPSVRQSVCFVRLSVRHKSPAVALGQQLWSSTHCLNFVKIHQKL